MSVVAVYGSLLKGLHNHSFLEESTFIKNDTVEGFDMYALSSFPGIIEGYGKVKVELWEVNESTLNSLDGLEGHPRHYKRTNVITESGEEVMIYVYQYKVDQRAKVLDGDWYKFYQENYNERS